MKHLFIINPAAGSRDRTEYYSRQIHDACGKRGLNYEIRVSDAPGGCARLAREAAQTGEEYRLYACGGDGTLNEVASAAAGCPNVAVTVFSGGSGNDFVKLFDDPQAFFDLERLLDSEEAEFDMIRCNDDLALNICSVGLDARIGTDVANYKRIPLLHGFRAYAVSTVVNLFRGIAEHYVVEVNGERIDREHTFVCVCNGRFYGGGFNPVPEAVIGKYKNGRYKELPHLVRHLKTKSIKIICDKPTPINLDGELRTAREVTMEVAQEKLRFFYPRGLSFAAKAPVHMK